MTERALVLTHVPRARRAGVGALLALDDRLGEVLRSGRNPMLAQMRLTWWHEVLSALDDAPPPDEPTLRALAAEVLPAVPGRTLAELVTGWEALLEEPLGWENLLTHGAERGGRLFSALGAVLGTGEPRLRAAGEGWALADLAQHLSDPALAEEARLLATERLDQAFRSAWPGAARPLGALALLARADVAAVSRPAGHPARAARLLVHRLTGR